VAKDFSKHAKQLCDCVVRKLSGCISVVAQRNSRRTKTLAKTTVLKRKKRIMKKQKIGATPLEHIVFFREISYLTVNPAQNPAQFKSPFAAFLIRGDR